MLILKGFSVQRKFAIIVPDAFRGESSDRGDLARATATKRSQDFGFIGKVGQPTLPVLNPLDDHRDTLTATDARGRQTVTTVAAMQFVQ